MNARLLATLGTMLLLVAGLFVYSEKRRAASRPIRAGILHSLTGTMSISERSVVDAALIAVEEINRRGGILGRRVEPVVADGRSDPETFASEAERLISDEGVSVLFGCWTSASRKMVKPVVEERNHLLVYPVQYEGLESSPNIVYTGAAPNQQIVPAVKWCFDHLGKRFFLVGSDYVFPRTANAIIRDQVTALGGQVVDEQYLLLGSNDVAAVARRIASARPDVVLNTINGDTNVAFFRALKRLGVSPNRTPVLSFSVAEDELRSMGAADAAGHYAAWNYFQSLPDADNVRFVERFRARYGESRVTDDPIEAGYFGVHLWAQAVQDAGTDEVARVREAFRRQSMGAPGGVVYVDPDTLHTWKTVRIGRIRKDGQFQVVWSSERPVRPVPYPVSRSEGEWSTFLLGLYRGWGGRWSNPGSKTTTITPAPLPPGSRAPFNATAGHADG